MKHFLTLSIVVCCVAMTPLAHAQSVSDMKTIAGFVECKLDARQIQRFIDRMDSNGVPDFVSLPSRPKGVDLAWQTRKPITAWGATSNLVSLVSPREMLLAIPAPVGQEIDTANQWAARIGDMHEDSGTVAMREKLHWHGVDYRKAVGKKEIRLLVDQDESPGWLLLGCGYDQLFSNN
ncbi:hypothetical protein [Paraburkholderia sp. BL21I4N1]|uniref:hypothetical protein n=1 Tax=Paraburkholderia sp. BL21I4N1 TaxID=1938801 RepID=UPI000D3F2E04|nr:hypothetical protein [Paraburkholderia sp. BL21I4N1]PQV44566.1 hypothetical protein B0G83_12274 [Paraburkholderia sp. BL21I4N1]